MSLRRRNLLSANNVSSPVDNELPAGYTKVFAITPAASGAYIDTGIDIKNDVTLSGLKFQLYTDLFSRIDYTPFVGASGNGEFMLVVQNKYLTFRPCFDQSSKNVTFSMVDNPLTVSNGLEAAEFGINSELYAYVKDLFDENGVSMYGSAAVPGNYASGNLTLFRAKTSYGLVTIARFKMWNNGDPVLDMVACKRNSDNVYGMYDKISDTFFTSASEQAFTEVQQS